MVWYFYSKLILLFEYFVHLIVWYRFYLLVVRNKNKMSILLLLLLLLVVVDGGIRLDVCEFNRPMWIPAFSSISRWFPHFPCWPIAVCVPSPWSPVEFSCLPFCWPLSVWYSTFASHPSPVSVHWQIKNGSILIDLEGQKESRSVYALTNSPKVGLAPHAIKVSSAEITIDVFEHPILVICHPDKSCTGFGYMFASPVFLFWPNKYNTPMSLIAKL